MKNKELIAINIEEARDELTGILSDLKRDSDYSEIELKIALEHAYHHINYAWNIRNINKDRIDLIQFITLLTSLVFRDVNNVKI